MELQILLNNIIDKQNLSLSKSMELMGKIFQGKLSPALIAAFLTALRMKGETTEELLGFITVMRKHMLKVQTSGLVIDVCGTGGDGKGTFNISTAVGFVVAGAGVKVAKHGNRNASSLCGSADVLEELGVNINHTPDSARRCLEEAGFVFLFAPLFHPAMKHVGLVRKELKTRTVFNFLGPFVSPAQVKRQIIGVPSIELAEKLAHVATYLNYDHLMLISGEDGLDEISLASPTHIYEVKGSKVEKTIIDTNKLGFGKATIEEIKGADAKTNAQFITDILDGLDGPKREIVLVNSAAALIIAGKAKNLKEGVLLSQKSIRNGNAKEVLAKVIKYSASL